jgi:integrase/recombinase XerC
MKRATSLLEEVEAFLHHQTTARNVSRHTTRAYAGDLVELSAAIEEKGPVPAARVDLAALRRHLASLKERGLVPRSIARKISAIRALFRWLAAEGRIETDPAAALRVPKRGRPLPKVLSQEEAKRLLESPKGDGWTALRDRAVLETLYSTGARVAETAGMNVEDIDLEAGAVILRGKGGKERVAGLGRPALAALAAYLSASDSPARRRHAKAVFLNKHGGPRASSRGTARSRGCPRGRAPTCCATPSRRTSSKPGPTSARCRRCSGTRASRRRRSTRT